MAIEMGIFKEYQDTINEVKNNLFHLYEKYHNCQSLLNYDYANGLVSEQEYRRARRLSFITYDKSINPKYMLTEDEIAYIKFYADLTNTNELSNYVIKDQFEKKLDILNQIGDTIRRFYILDNIDEKRRKDMFRVIVENYYNPLIKEDETEINRLKTALGPNYYASLKYHQINDRLQANIKERDSYFKTLENCSYQEFMTLVSKFYDIDLNIYKWYKQRFIKEECEKEFTTTDPESEVDKVQTIIGDMADKNTRISDIHQEVVEISLLLTSLIGEIIGDSLEQERQNKPLFKRKSKSNKEELLTIFTYYMNYPIFKKFLEQFNQNEEFNLTNTFNLYFAHYYNNRPYVNPHEFKQKLILDAINYLKQEIEELTKQMQQAKDSLNNTTDNLKEQVSNVKRYTSIRKYYDENDNSLNTIDKPLLDLGFTEVEINRIYEDIKIYITSNITRELLDGPKLNMKAGN